MIDAVGLARGLNVAAGSTVAGMLVLALLTSLGSTQHVARDPDVALLKRWALALAVLFLATAAASIWMQAAQAAGTTVATWSHADALDFMRSTRVGQVWLVRIVLMCIAAIVLLSTRPGTRRVHRFAVAIAATAALGAQGMLALASHAVSAEDARAALAMQIIHAIAASIWLGGLAYTALLVVRSISADDGADALRRFSNVALVAMLVIIATGVFSAIEQLDRWPPLFGTPYGYRLLAKMLFLLAVLACAAYLRFVWLSQSRTGATATRRTLLALLVIEGLCGLLVMLLAGQLAVTTPGRHDAIDWHFGFRIDAERLWPDPQVQRQVWAAVAIGAALALGAALARVVMRSRLPGTGLIAALVLGIVIAIAIGVPPLTVEAYPDTYRQSSVAYDATSIAAGRKLYVTHCVSCHGVDATGNGPLARTLPKPPADLTAPHAGEHTPGDLYWWLTHGMRGKLMPGFAQHMSSDERWDVINYLHTLSRGYQARIIKSRVVPGRPWLGAPLFSYTTRENISGTLREFRERSAVVLVLFSWPGSNARMATLVAANDAITTAGASLLAVPMHHLAPDELAQLPATLTIVGDGSEEIAASYALFRRTLDNARVGESGPIPSHMEFLIDRYGYLRARWIPDDPPSGWSNEAQLLEQLRLLEAEPRIKPPPDDHLH